MITALIISRKIVLLWSIDLHLLIILSYWVMYFNCQHFKLMFEDSTFFGLPCKLGFPLNGQSVEGSIFLSFLFPFPDITYLNPESYWVTRFEQIVKDDSQERSPPWLQNLRHYVLDCYDWRCFDKSDVIFIVSIFSFFLFLANQIVLLWFC